MSAVAGRGAKMHEILVPLVSGGVRFFLGLFEFLGFLWDTDFCLTDGLFSAKTLVAVLSRMRRQKAS